jgi:excisionase family DNA binding protein
MPQKILSSWKEIAAYLGHSKRTVQRWEQELSLPVYRPAGRESHSVMAFVSQLDDWLQSFTSNSYLQHQTSGHRNVTAMATSLSNHESLTTLEKLLWEEDAIFEQLQQKRAEIRRMRAEAADQSSLPALQSRAAVMS